jgi:hypothetical protein
MNGVQRREEILKLIENSDLPMSGSSLSKLLGVSRQVIVQDIALLKAAGVDILATNKGYIFNTPERVSRVVKVVHTDDEVGDELNAVVDLGGCVEDVFVWHRIYGKIEAKLGISSRRNVSEYLESLKTGRSSPLKNVTSGYHYHTITAQTEHILDLIEEELNKKGYLVRDED